MKKRPSLSDIMPEEIARAKAIPGFVRFTPSGGVVISAEQAAPEAEERECLTALMAQIDADPQGEFERRIEPIMEMIDVHGEDDLDSLALAETIILAIGNGLAQVGVDSHQFAGQLREVARRLEEAEAVEDAADARLYYERMAELAPDDAPELGDAFFREAVPNEGAGAVDVGDEDYNRVMAGLDYAKAMIEGGPRKRK